MNSEEGVSLAKMAVTVLLVVLVIGAVVAIVYKAYSWFNSGADKLGDQVNSIDSSSYSSYDDVQVSGTDVLTALKSYRDSNIAIVISNQQCGGYKQQSGVDSHNMDKGYNYCGLLSGKTVSNVEVTATDVKWDQNEGHYVASNGIQWNDETGLADRNTNFSPTTAKNSKETFVKQGGQFYANLIWDSTTGEVCGILFRQMGN